MSTTLNRTAFQQLVNEDVAYLRSLPNQESLELRHVISIVASCVAHYYPPKPCEAAAPVPASGPDNYEKPHDGSWRDELRCVKAGSANVPASGPREEPQNDLDAIKARLQTTNRRGKVNAEALYRLFDVDVPGLIAEVERLRAAAAPPLSLTPPLEGLKAELSRFPPDIQAHWTLENPHTRLHALLRDLFKETPAAAPALSLTPPEFEDLRCTICDTDIQTLACEECWQRRLKAPALSLTGLRELVGDVYGSHRDKHSGDSDWTYDREKKAYIADEPCDWCVKAKPLLDGLPAPQPASSGLRELVEKQITAWRNQKHWSDHHTCANELDAALRAATEDK